MISIEKETLTIDFTKTGNYYYYEDSSMDIRKGELIAYGIAIYDQNSKETYTDFYNYWKVKGNFVYCELDERAKSGDQTCSTGK